ncbi:flavin reductase [Tianweitania sp.]|uniref:flavin reductase n=1 Tax=Tianweitania sp. TaxID=2021634 RepID=UPI0028975B99|nr:flavin reductase [Tianweitania sp.]
MTDTRALRDAFGAFLTGVTVVTAVNGEGAPIGFTANSFTSVSLDPPLLLVCLAKTSRNLPTLMAVTGFGVNVLSEGQKNVSNTFARPVEDRFAAVEWKEGPHGSPVFNDAAAWFDCSVHERIDAGDHVVMIGRVEAFDNSGKTGLGYARGGYFTPALTENKLLANVDGAVEIGAVVERDGQILLVPSKLGGWTLPFFDKPDVAQPALEPLMVEQLGVNVRSGLLYSVYDDSETGQHRVVYRAALGDGQPEIGRMFPLSQLPLEDVPNPAVRDLLKRYAQESTLNEFGIYFGNQEKGRVHAVANRG